MMKEVESGKVRTILIKDMSRMGRDYLKVGQYMELLRQKNVRLIAVNENVDSFREDDDFTPFRNIMNEWYARDTSKKIKSTFKAKGKSGKHVASTTPYGYLKDKDDPNVWIVDEEAAVVVRRIFHMTMDGYGPYQIARALKEDKVEIPAVHMAKKDAGLWKGRVVEIKDPYGWGSSTVAGILKKREYLGFELPNPEKKRSKTNNRKVVFDSACRTMFLDICKRHGLEIDEEPSYGGRQYLEKQDYIRMKQKEEIAVQQEMLNQQRDKVNANHLELARQSNHVRANEKVIQSQKEKIEQQEKEFKENFISNSDRILSQGELIEEQREELQQLTLRIEDVETLLDEVSSEAYDKAVDKVAEETMRATRKDDIRLAEDSKRWIQSPERKASRKEKEYAINRLDGLIKKIEYAMEKAVVRVVRQLKQPEKKKAVVEEIKKEVKPSIREKLALNVAKIQREEAERKQLNKGRSHSSDLEL